MKKTLSIIVTVFLVVAFATTGVFAESFDSYPPVGSVITEVPINKCFFSLDYATVQTLPSSASEAVPLFNNIYAYQSGGLYVYFGLYDGSSISWSDSGRFMISTSTATNFWYRDLGSYIALQCGNYGYAFDHSGGSSGNYVVYLNSLGRGVSNVDTEVTIGSSYQLADSTVINTFHLSLPYGNAMRIYSDSAFTITARSYTVRDTTYNFQKYVRASDDFSYRVNGTYHGVVQNSSLVGNIGLSVYGSDNVISLLVPWQPINQNILGRATEYNYYSASPDPSATVSVGSGESFLIWYPYYANNQDTSKLNEVPMDMAITIEYTSPVFFMTYPITGNPSAGEDIYISNTSDVSDSGSSQQTDDGDGNVTVTFDNAPTAGGNHGQAPINQNNSILGVLSNLQNTLLGLFNKAIDGIHNLISLGSSFLQSVQVMFSWLPAELLVIITSGFVILLTIGVLKTLWR